MVLWHKKSKHIEIAQEQQRKEMKSTYSYVPACAAHFEDTLFSQKED